MFQELMPLLAQRMLILTLSRVSDEEICINVIPKQLKSDQQNDDTALATPLAVTGSPKDLDEHFPKHLAEFVEAHLGLSSTLKCAKEQIDAAAKAAREAAKKSTSLKSHSGSKKSVTTNSAQVQTGTDTQANSEDSQSGNRSTQAVVAGTSPLGLEVSTGSLFDTEVRDDH